MFTSFTLFTKSLTNKIKYRLRRQDFVFFSCMIDDMPVISDCGECSFKVLDGIDKFILIDWILTNNPANTYDLKCIKKNIGNNKIVVGYIDNEIVHYFFIFFDPFSSPLSKTTFDLNLVGPNDVYLGSAFTMASCRDSWIMLKSLTFTKYYLLTLNLRRAFLFVSRETPGAVSFWRRLNFNEILL